MGVAIWRDGAFSGNMVQNATLPPLFDVFDKNLLNYSSKGLGHIKQKILHEITNQASYITFFCHKNMQRYDYLKIMFFFWAPMGNPYRSPKKEYNFQMVISL